MGNSQASQSIRSQIADIYSWQRKGWILRTAVVAPHLLYTSTALHLNCCAPHLLFQPGKVPSLMRLQARRDRTLPWPLVKAALHHCPHHPSGIWVHASNMLKQNSRAGRAIKPMLPCDNRRAGTRIHKELVPKRKADNATDCFRRQHLGTRHNPGLSNDTHLDQAHRVRVLESTSCLS